MVVWSGRGILSVLVLLGVLFICVSIFPKEWSDIGFSVSFFAAAIFSYFFGMKWNNSEAKIYIDKTTSKEVHVLANHSLFWIKMQYWGIIYLILMLLIISSNFNTQGVVFILSIVLGLLAVLTLSFFVWELFKYNFENKAEYTNNNDVKKELIEVTPKFVKEEIKEIKNNDESHDRFMPK